jgi:ribosomal protein L37AE/L43A
MQCPSCKAEIKHPPAFWQDRIAPWSCSNCGGLYGIRNNGDSFGIPAGFRPLAPLLPEKQARRWCYHAHLCNYVYALCYPTGIPFYVGVGVLDRAIEHVVETRRLGKQGGLRFEKNQEIARLLSSGQGVWYHFLCLTDSRQESLETESFWINYWEMRHLGGMLTNLEYPPTDPELTKPEPPPLPDGIEEPEPRIVVFQHPDMVACPPSPEELEGGKWPHDTISCNACGSQSYISKRMAEKHLICPSCGHYTYGMHFREMFPLKMFRNENMQWEIRKRPPKDW